MYAERKVHHFERPPGFGVPLFPPPCLWSIEDDSTTVAALTDSVGRFLYEIMRTPEGDKS